jgi:hypothetical protein
MEVFQHPFLEENEKGKLVGIFPELSFKNHDLKEK